MKIELNEALQLSGCINTAIHAFDTSQKFKESEVQFRYDAIKGMLIIAQQDVFQMIIDWTR